MICCECNKKFRPETRAQRQCEVCPKCETEYQQPTPAQIDAYVATCKAIADAIRELGSVPSGHLYAQVMGHMSLEVYNRVIADLVAAGLIRKEPSHLLVWLG